MMSDPNKPIPVEFRIVAPKPKRGEPKTMVELIRPADFDKYGVVVKA